jgi:hypothetical protein
VPVDVTGDSKTDFVVVRNTGGGPSGALTWFLAQNLRVAGRAPADFDGNGRTDFALVRNTGGGPSGALTWFVESSRVTRRVQADFTGDGKTDLAVVRNTGGGPSGALTWLVRNGYTPFTDDDLTAGVTPVRAVHVTELRNRIDAVRARYGLEVYAYGPAVGPGSTTIRVQQILDLREALRQAYVAAGRAAPTYTDPTPIAGTTIVKAVHITELRAALTAIE